MFSPFSYPLAESKAGDALQSICFYTSLSKTLTRLAIMH